MEARALMTRLVAAVVLSGLATSAVAQGAGAPDVDIKLAAKYCEAIQSSNRDKIDAGALSACMREFGYSSIRFGAGARF